MTKCKCHLCGKELKKELDSIDFKMSIGYNSKLDSPKFESDICNNCFGTLRRLLLFLSVAGNN